MGTCFLVLKERTQKNSMRRKLQQGKKLSKTDVGLQLNASVPQFSSSTFTSLVLSSRTNSVRRSHF